MAGYGSTHAIHSRLHFDGQLRFLAAPFSLSQTVVGLLSVVYLTGTYNSTRAGEMTARHGRGY